LLTGRRSAGAAQLPAPSAQELSGRTRWQRRGSFSHLYAKKAAAHAARAIGARIGTVKDPVTGNLGTYRQVLGITVGMAVICVGLVVWAIVQPGDARVVPILCLLFMMSFLAVAVRALVRHPDRPRRRSTPD